VAVLPLLNYDFADLCSCIGGSATKFAQLYDSMFCAHRGTFVCCISCRRAELHQGGYMGMCPICGHISAMFVRYLVTFRCVLVAVQPSLRLGSKRPSAAPRYVRASAVWVRQLLQSSKVPIAGGLVLSLSCLSNCLDIIRAATPHLFAGFGQLCFVVCWAPPDWLFHSH
jgi:hypothetical protein